MLNATEIRELRESKKLTQEEVATAMGVSRESISQIEIGKTKADGRAARRYIEYLENYNKDSRAAEKPATYNQKNKLVPYFNIDVTGGSGTELFADTPETADYLIDMPGFSDCDFSVPIYGHSMYPKICSGNIVFCKRIEYLEFIEYGQIYLIITKDNRRMVKVIRRGKSDENLLLISENAETFDPVEIPRKLVKGLFLVKGWANKNEI